MDLTYHSHRREITIPVVSLDQAAARAQSAERPTARAQRMIAVRQVVQTNAAMLSSVLDPASGALVASSEKSPRVSLVATETTFIEGATKAVLKTLKSRFGMTVVQEGLFGKVLLRNNQLSGKEAVENAFKCANYAYKSTKAKAAHPNFNRVIQHTMRPATTAPLSASKPWWNHLNDGTVGVAGADAAVRAAWTITKGNSNIRVAVLDEGVDVAHPDLVSAIVAQKDFVDGNATAQPSGKDAHGTACSGIIVGRGTVYPGITECSLVAVRIAKGDGHDGWIFDDFKTADAIDWAWKDAKSDVLSNSWGGGTPVDAISNAFERARTQGRNNKGCVIAIATGNSDSSVNYPATLPNILAVGASNEWDERKSPTSHDGEDWWGSNYGPEVQLVAPGVHIATTDISGASGYSPGNYITTFNGTSSATPHVAAAAALILSIAPNLKESEVREILTQTATRLKPTGNLDGGGRNNEMGWGRLDIFAALRRASHPR